MTTSRRKRFGKRRKVGSLRARVLKKTKRKMMRKKARFSVERVRLDSQGYTSRGTYYGVGAPLYRVYDEKSGEALGVTRAPNAGKAREKLARELLAKGEYYTPTMKAIGY